MLIDYLVLVMEVFRNLEVHRVPYKFSEPDKALAQTSNPKRAKPEESRGSLPKVLESRPLFATIQIRWPRWGVKIPWTN